ncbi:hypothetical protein JG687_00003005 [Phytophthora cactorum]|uniref:Uncharacterized protein n=1 Tax=Phytophthora cactorum TaxID=29920 RepID=A0A329SDE5_9STRA|nr:hypothetical protein PC117_g7146 [Phytophthora cactorum]KAG6969771.1 hypothetical protein JG687_00003005 [Phytophthora cactorum]RAW33612.1 hypothetical protein PC110_g10085 [Phytophthora cactorum]
MKRKSRGDESEDSREESSGGSERASPPHAGDVCSDGDDEEEADPQVARDSGRGSDGDDSLNDLAGEDESLKVLSCVGITQVGMNGRTTARTTTRPRVRIWLFRKPRAWRKEINSCGSPSGLRTVGFFAICPKTFRAGAVGTSAHMG